MEWHAVSKGLSPPVPLPGHRLGLRHVDVNRRFEGAGRPLTVSMLLPDPTIDTSLLEAMLDREYADDREPLTFVPAGGDSWCYRARPWWVSVRRDRAGHHPGAYAAAVELAQAGLEFVLAPARGRSGEVVQAVSRWPSRRRLPVA